MRFPPLTPCATPDCDALTDRRICRDCHKHSRTTLPPHDGGPHKAPSTLRRPRAKAGVVQDQLQPAALTSRLAAKETRRVESGFRGVISRG